jgi:tetratricopeptide (TPR) repeat protein
MRVQRFLSLSLLIVFLITFLTNIPTVSQETDQVKKQLFYDLKKELKTAIKENVPLLSPANFTEAAEYYQMALQEYEGRGNLAEIRRHLDASEQKLKTAFESASISRTVIEELIELRNDVMQLELAKYSAEGARAKYFWGRFLTEGDFQEEQEYNLPKADEKFKDAAMKIEQGDLNGAKASAATAAQEYRRAALEVFQNVVLRDARNELAKKDSTISDPQFQEARVELDQIEEYIINQSTVVFSIGELFAEVFDRAQDALTLTGVSGREIEKPDLHIGEIEFSPQHPEAGEQVIISAEIANVGQNAAEKIFIKLLDDEGNEIGQEVIESLDKGNSTKVTFPYTPGKAGNWRVILWVDPEDLIPENIELNNKGSNVIPVVNFKWTHTKDLKKFSKKELFLSSDNYWRNVLKLVPLTTWRFNF